MTGDDGEIGQRLSRMNGGLGRIEEGLAAVRRSVVHEQVHLTGWGFAGIARNLQRVVACLDEIRGGVAKAATSVHAARERAEGVKGDITPAHAVSVLSPLSSAIDACVEQMAAIDAGMASAQVLLLEVLEGGQPAVLVGRVQALRDQLVVVPAGLGAAKSQILRAVSEARRAGAVAGAGRAPVSAAVSPPPGSPFALPSPDVLRRAAAHLPARRPDERVKGPGERNDPTHGVVLNDAAGSVQVGPVLRSAVRGPNMGRPGLRRDMRWGSPNHVENHVAAMMRADRSLRQVSVVINNPEVCNPRQRNPDDTFKQYTCDEQLAAQLPRGARLTVYVPDPSTGQRLWTTYVGTGEGLIEP